MPETMKAWQKHFGPTEPQLVDVPVPTCSDDGLLIKVHAAGVCHSDFALIVSGSTLSCHDRFLSVVLKVCWLAVGMRHKADLERMKARVIEDTG
jgi:hypothetical protein